MNTFFQKMGSALKTGWNTLTNVIKAPVGPGITFTSPFFPAPQKKVITGAEVSKTPAAPTVGYRPQAKGATTLGQKFQNWWSNTYETGRRIWDGFKTSFQGYTFKEMGKDLGKTAGQVIKETSKQAITYLPDYFMQKWGLKPRAYSGEVTDLGNQVQYQNETQSNAPVTQPSGIAEFFAAMLGSQPKGTYNIGMPQSAPIPVSVPVPVGTQAVDRGISGNMMFIGLILIAVVGGYFFLRKGK